MYKPLLETLVSKKICPRIPVWIMRQAGRYLPEYRQIRNKHHNFIDFCLNPKAASEVTLQPLKRFDLDGAIIFSDILIIPHLLGQKVNFEKNVGPVLEPIRTYQDLKKLKDINMAKAENVFEAINITAKEIDKNYKNVALIGFAGAPWTVATYMVEGGSSKNFTKVKGLMYKNEEIFSELIDIIVENTIIYLKKQIEAGAEIIKIFDSWAGVLTEEDYEKWVIQPTEKIIKELKKEKKNIPIITFPKNSSIMYKKYMNLVNTDCIAVDQFTPLEWIKKNNKKNIVIQGNLDNVLLLMGSKEQIKQQVRKKKELMSKQAYIFNLGHGILPETPIKNVISMIEALREESNG